MKTVDIIKGQLVIGNSFEFTNDLSAKVTPIDITKDVIKALNLRIAKCLNDLESNVNKGIACTNNNTISYDKGKYRRHFSIMAYKKMIEAVDMLLAGKTIEDLDTVQRVQVLKALATMHDDLFECCEKELAIDVATDCLLTATN